MEWGDIDRFFKGIRLYELNKSNMIVFTGGNNPYNKTKISEGKVLEKFATNYGVKKEDISITKDVLNTSDEAKAVLDLIGANKTIILVTSAFHMKRAKLLFERQGINVTPYKVDYKTPPSLELNFIDIIPSSSGLRKSEIAFREIIGRLYYSIIIDIVGPICETGDFLAKDRNIKANQGDILAIMDAGAYGFSMSSNYNSRPRIPEVMVDKDEFYLIRERENFSDLIAHEKKFLK